MENERHVSKSTYSTPDGLRKLMKNISVQVLKSQPNMESLYQFIADYLNSQLIARDSQQSNNSEQKTHDPTHNATNMEKGASKETANGASTFTQATLRGNRTKQNVKVNQAAEEEQTAVEQRGADLIRTTSRTDETEQERVNRAAVVIQRKFRNMNSKTKKENPPGEPQVRPRNRAANATLTTRANETIDISEERSSQESESDPTMLDQDDEPGNTVDDDASDKRREDKEIVTTKQNAM